MISRNYVTLAVSLACSFYAWAPVLAQPLEEPSEPNKEVVRLYIDGLWNNLRYELIEQVLSPDVVAHAADGTQEVGRERFREVIPGLRSALPDLHLSIEEMVAEGDCVAVRLRATGTHKGNLFGMAPSGRRLDVPEWFFFRLSDGKIIEYWYLRDHAQIRRQLTQ